MGLRAHAFYPLDTSHSVREIVRDHEVVELVAVACGEARCENRGVENR